MVETEAGREEDGKVRLEVGNWMWEVGMRKVEKTEGEK